MQSIANIQRIITPIAKTYGVRRVFLFGSYAKGTATEDSDVDLLIEKGRKLTLLGLAGIRQEASESLALPVDVVTTAALDEEMRASIMGSEVLLYEEEG